MTEPPRRRAMTPEAKYVAGIRYATVSSAASAAVGAHHRLPQPTSTPTLGQCEAEFSFIHDAKLADFRIAPSAAMVVSEQRRSSLPVPRLYRIGRMDRRAWNCSPVVTPMRRRPPPGARASLSASGASRSVVLAPFSSNVTRCRMLTLFPCRASKATVAEIVHSVPKQVAFHVSRCVPYARSHACCTCGSTKSITSPTRSACATWKTRRHSAARGAVCGWNRKRGQAWARACASGSSAYLCVCRRAGRALVRARATVFARRVTGASFLAQELRAQVKVLHGNLKLVSKELFETYEKARIPHGAGRAMPCLASPWVGGAADELAGRSLRRCVEPLS